MNGFRLINECITSAAGRTYMRRFGIEVFGVAVMLHKITQPDPSPDLHDHPWPFLSICIWGGYVEEVRCNRLPSLGRWSVARIQHHRMGGIRVMGRGVFHRVRMLHRRSCWTLVLRGRRSPGGWGFLKLGEFVPADVYLRDQGHFDVSRVRKNNPIMRDRG